MNKYLSIINPLFIIASGVLLIMTVQVWLKPDPDVESSVNIKTTPKKLEKVYFESHRYATPVLNDVVENNLFRKERKPYRKPANRKSAPPQVAKREPLVVPPPQYVLSGVLLTRTAKVAFMEGEYSEDAGNRKAQKKQLKRRGYEIGEMIGKYRITEIQKAFVALTDAKGDVMTVRIRKHDRSKTARKPASTTVRNATRKNIRVKAPVRPHQKTTVPTVSEKPKPRPPARQNVLGAER